MGRILHNSDQEEGVFYDCASERMPVQDGNALCGVHGVSAVQTSE